jgi:UDP-N-acetylmuramoyl-tripeptide--D-alanyl-D-alanine ligase
MFKVFELVKATGGKLVSGNMGLEVEDISIDSRQINKGSAFIAIKGDKFDGHDFVAEVVRRGAKCIIGHKLVKVKGAAFILVKDTQKALADIARFNRQRFDIPVIAVTGSNGKTTTKDMIAAVLSRKFKVLKNEGTKNNHIGLPLTLLKLDGSYDAVVLEMGTNHFGEIDYLSRIAMANICVITNIGPSHLEYFKNLKGVFKEKSSLIRNIEKPGVVVVNKDDPYLKGLTAKKSKAPFVISVGINEEADFRASDLVNLRGKPAFKVNGRFKFALSAFGYYNSYNSLLAIAVGRIFGLGYRDIALELSRFSLPKSRLNLLLINKVQIIDDTYNANPLSLRQALGVLESFPAKGKKVAVLGDMLELGSLSNKLHEDAVRDALKVCNILVTVGKTMASVVKSVFPGEDIFTCDTSLEAGNLLFKTIHVKSGDLVLVKGSRSMKMEEVFRK